MSIQNFIAKENIKTLWEVISDEDMFRYLSRDIQANVHQVFLNNIQGFYETEKMKNINLVNLNKKYIMLILNHIKQTHPIQPNKIKIHNEPVKELITFEDIQNNRKTQFEQEFGKRQQEFNDMITVKTPDVPQFSEKQIDGPIKEMDKILKEMQIQRNYEIDSMNQVQYNTSQANNWLKPQETSLKSEKITGQELEDSKNYSRFKYLDTLDQDNYDSPKEKKNVSFSSNIEDIQTYNYTYTIEDEEENNIFAKLKKTPENKSSENSISIQFDEIRNEDRISKIEREIKDMHNKLDKIVEFIYKNNAK